VANSNANIANLAVKMGVVDQWDPARA
jgi:hypothetical protein